MFRNYYPYKKKSWSIVANKNPHNNYENGCSFPKYMIVVMEIKFK